MRHKITVVLSLAVAVTVGLLAMRAYDHYNAQRLLDRANQQAAAAAAAKTQAKAKALYVQAAQNLQAYCQKAAALNANNVGQKTTGLQAPNCTLPPLQ